MTNEIKNLEKEAQERLDKARTENAVRRIRKSLMRIQETEHELSNLKERHKELLETDLSEFDCEISRCDCSDCGGSCSLLSKAELKTFTSVPRPYTPYRRLIRRRNKYGCLI